MVRVVSRQLGAKWSEAGRSSRYSEAHVWDSGSGRSCLTAACVRCCGCVMSAARVTVVYTVLTVATWIALPLMLRWWPWQDVLTWLGGAAAISVGTYAAAVWTLFRFDRFWARFVACTHVVILFLVGGLLGLFILPLVAASDSSTPFLWWALSAFLPAVWELIVFASVTAEREEPSPFSV